VRPNGQNSVIRADATPNGIAMMRMTSATIA